MMAWVRYSRDRSLRVLISGPDVRSEMEYADLSMRPQSCSLVRSIKLASLSVHGAYPEGLRNVRVLHNYSSA